MLKFQITTKNDLKEAAAIQRRKQYEEERKKRIFNARQRLFGQDHETLEKQINEKRMQRQAEIELDKKYLEESARRGEVIRMKEGELKQERHRIESDINFFRCRFQRKEDSREYDLNDPDFHKKSQPARIADKDPRLGISSAQIFIGEDLMGVDRKKNQKEQLRAWLQQQIRERKQAENDRAVAEKHIHKALEIQDKQALEFHFAEINNRARMQESVAEYNKKLALEQEAKKKLEKKHEQEDNMAEIYNLLTSDMLTENPDVAKSPVSLTKKIAYLYRGMSAEELEQFRREQRMQRETINKRKTEEALVHSQWVQYSHNIDRTAVLKEREINRERRNIAEELSKENTELAKEQKTREEFLKKVVYTNQPTSEYFEQFNKTSR